MTRQVRDEPPVTPAGPRLVHLSGSAVAERRDQLAAAYAEIFSGSPWPRREPGPMRAEFAERLDTDRTRGGFRAVVAVAGDGTVAGFATGWITAAPFRTDRAYGRVRARLGPRRVGELLVGALEVDELGVLPHARGTGLGRRLLNAVTADAPRGRAWLLTWDRAHPTLAFYRRLGWTEPPPVPGAATDVVVFLKPARVRR